VRSLGTPPEKMPLRILTRRGLRVSASTLNRPIRARARGQSLGASRTPAGRRPSKFDSAGCAQPKTYGREGVALPFLEALQD